MRLVKTLRTRHETLQALGFSIMEATVASGVVGVMLAALLSGLTTSVGHVQFGREQNRATQIMMEKMDLVRMYRWDRIKDGASVVTNFTDYYFPPGSLGNTTNAPATGTVYKGSISIGNAGMAEDYNDLIRKVTVSVQWQSGNRQIQRQMTTYVSKHGLQLYIP